MNFVRDLFTLGNLFDVLDRCFRVLARERFRDPEVKDTPPRSLRRRHDPADVPDVSPERRRRLHMRVVIVGRGRHGSIQPPSDVLPMHA